MEHFKKIYIYEWKKYNHNNSKAIRQAPPKPKMRRESACRNICSSSSRLTIFIYCFRIPHIVYMWSLTNSRILTVRLTHSIPYSIFRGSVCGGLVLWLWLIILGCGCCTRWRKKEKLWSIIEGYYLRMECQFVGFICWKNKKALFLRESYCLLRRMVRSNIGHSPKTKPIINHTRLTLKCSKLRKSPSLIATSAARFSCNKPTPNNNNKPK